MNKCIGCGETLQYEDINKIEHKVYLKILKKQFFLSYRFLIFSKKKAKRLCRLPCPGGCNLTIYHTKSSVISI